VSNINRLKKIKEKYSNPHKWDRAFLILDKDFDWLIEVAEAAEDFVESFECITGPEDKCHKLKQTLNNKGCLNAQ
jgi:hypothetical protein